MSARSDMLTTSLIIGICNKTGHVLKSGRYYTVSTNSDTIEQGSFLMINPNAGIVERIKFRLGTVSKIRLLVHREIYDITLHFSKKVPTTTGWIITNIKRLEDSNDV